MEKSIAAAAAAVYYFDGKTKSWVHVDGGLSSVNIFKNTPKPGTYRVVAMSLKQPGATPINSAIFTRLEYRRPTSFSQWCDTRNTYGLNFASEKDADNFEAVMKTCIAECELEEIGKRGKQAAKSQGEKQSEKRPVEMKMSGDKNVSTAAPQSSSSTSTLNSKAAQQTALMAPRSSTPVLSNGASSGVPPRRTAFSPASAGQSQQASSVVGGINLSKGQNVALAGLSKVTVGLGWDPNDSASSVKFDVDAACFMLGDGDKLQNATDFVFFNNLKSPCGSVEHTGDSTDGQGDGDDESIKVYLTKVPANIQKLLFCVQIHETAARGQYFGQINNSYVRVVDKSKGVETCSTYELHCTTRPLG